MELSVCGVSASGMSGCGMSPCGIFFFFFFFFFFFLSPCAPVGKVALGVVQATPVSGLLVVM